MPTSSFTDSTFSANAIGARTDASGTAVTDLAAEEARLPLSLFSAGYLAPANAFQVQAQASPNMTVKVGSGSPKVDTYIVAGSVAGQGNYAVRLDATTPSLTVPAADASQPRTDEIYLVVQDNVYDVSARSLPRFGYRKGDLGGANPGPDATWKAYVLLARVTVAAAATSIVSGNISDQRSQAVMSGLGGQPNTLLTTKGDLIATSGPGGAARKAVGSNGQVLQADSAQALGLGWGGPAGSQTASVPASQNTTSTSYTDLATVGPSVTVTVGPSGMLLVLYGAAGWASPTIGGSMSFALSGANTLAPAVAGILSWQSSESGGIDIYQLSNFALVTGLAPGSTTVTAKYAANSGSTGQFLNRQIAVVTI